MAAKKNLAYYIRRELELEKRIIALQTELNIMKVYNIQQAIDLAQIALHEMKDGFGGQRNKEFERLYLKWWRTMMDAAKEEDAEERRDKVDHGLCYTITKFDQLLADALGGDCLPYEQRYSWQRLCRLGEDLNVPISPEIARALLEEEKE